MALTPVEQRHLEISRTWVGLFRRLCKKYNSQNWQLDGETRTLFDAATNSKWDEVKAAIRSREIVKFGAIHIGRQKVIHVLCEQPAFPKDYAYLGRWADVTVGRNFPFPTFIGNHTPESFANFEELFVQFLKVETEADVPAFEDYLQKKYQDNTYLLNDDDNFIEDASCPI
jgi:hypothetical protein